MLGVALKGLLGRKLRAALTAIAILLGVATVSGTYVLTDSIDKAFDSIFTEVRQGSNVVISGESAFDLSDGSGVTAPAFDESLLELPEVFAEDVDGEDGEFDPDEDPLLEKAIDVVLQTQTASVSLLQRRLRVGYTRAGRLIDMLERRGIISGYEGSKPRRVLVSESEQIVS